MSHGAEDASGGRRHIGRRKMHLEAEEASEAEAEFEMERHGRRGFPLQLVHDLQCGFHIIEQRFFNDNPSCFEFTQQFFVNMNTFSFGTT